MHPPKALRIADRIETEIRSGERPPGSWAPSVRALMERDHIASATGLKIHRILAERGLIKSTRGKGAVVLDEVFWVSSDRHARL